MDWRYKQRDGAAVQLSVEHFNRGWTMRRRDQKTHWTRDRSIPKTQQGKQSLEAKKIVLDYGSDS